MKTPLLYCLLLLAVLNAAAATDDPRKTPAVSVEFQDQHWHVTGPTRRVCLDPKTLALEVSSPERAWRFRASYAGDLLATHGGTNLSLRLADATESAVTPYATGYRSGVKLELGGFQSGDTRLDLRLQLWICLEGREEELLCEIQATDDQCRVRECTWPYGLEPDAFDTTVVPFMQGMLLPKHGPDKVWLYDHLSFGRGLYMPWFGHQQGPAALLALLETPEDAGCRFDHPEGGPTRIETRWVHSLGRWSYPRRARFSFFDRGDHVTLAKRYRRHVIESGRWVSLREKIARNPRVGRLIGAPVIHTSILYHIQPDSSYYHQDDPAKNHQLVSFDTRTAELETLAARNIRRAYVHLDGWGLRGYDNLHPDVLPPGPEAGGWEGMRRLADACERLGYVFAIHDQYRDYYLDAPSYDPRHTLLDAAGNRPFGSTWYGGKQSILCSRLAPGYVRRNHQALLEGGVKLQGAYLDVFAVVPPDECYHPEHPVTRAQCLEYRARCLNSVRAWGGVVSSEEPSDWAVPWMDLVHHGPYPLRPNPGRGPAMGVPIPLFNLVYHEALLIPWSLARGAWGIPENDLGYLHGLGNAGLPYLSLNPGDAELSQVRVMCALHQRVGMLELTGHVFLEANHRKQRFTYADGTTVTIDLDQDRFEIRPALTDEDLRILERAP